MFTAGGHKGLGHRASDPYRNETRVDFVTASYSETARSVGQDREINGRPPEMAKQRALGGTVSAGRRLTGSARFCIVFSISTSRNTERTMANRQKQQKGTKARQDKRAHVIAYRKSCKPRGTGLSHYILMDKKGK